METEEELAFQPEQVDAAVGVGSLYCFLNADRVCTADCMAYSTAPRVAASSELNAEQSHCVLLASAERVGRNVTVVASLLADKERKSAARVADERRQSELLQGPRSPLGAPKT